MECHAAQCPWKSAALPEQGQRAADLFNQHQDHTTRYKTSVNQHGQQCISWESQHQYQLEGLLSVSTRTVNTSVSWEGKWQQGLQCRYPGLQSAHYYQAAAALRHFLAAPDCAATAAAGPSHLHGVILSLRTFSFFFWGGRNSLKGALKSEGDS